MIRPSELSTRKNNFSKVKTFDDSIKDKGPVRFEIIVIFIFFSSQNIKISAYQHRLRSRVAHSSQFSEKFCLMGILCCPIDRDQYPFETIMLTSNMPTGTRSGGSTEDAWFVLALPYPFI
jgi:hypothetical protein